MPHFARIVIIAFALVAASCSAERAQQESEGKEIGRQLTAAYYSCVRTSFASMLPTMVDRNSGIDQAFMVCRTEQSKLQAFEEALSGNSNVSAVAMAAAPQYAQRRTLAVIVLVRRIARSQGTEHGRGARALRPPV